MDRARKVGEPPYFSGPLDERARDRRQVGPEDRLGEVEALVVLPRRHEERGPGLLGVVQHAERVAEARRDVDVGDAELRGRLGVAVRHGDDGGLLEAEDVRDLRLADQAVHQRQLGRPRVAEYVLDALLPQEPQERLLPRHERHQCLRWGRACLG
jgi:hypothetical protein